MNIGIRKALQTTLRWFPLIRKFRGPLDPLLRWFFHFSSSAPERACHLHELFITHEGHVFPCCRVWDIPRMRIGHLTDLDLDARISSFKRYCACSAFKLIPAGDDAKHDYELLNVELSLKCQANCAMCCVGAPEWRGTYDLYPALTSLMDRCRPKELLVQGGEIMVQPLSLAWLSEVAGEYPDTSISMISNGNVGTAKAVTIEGVITRITVSFVGFQEETYERIMGIRLSRTLAFVREALERKRIRVYLKYLLTPLSIHEANLFLRWAIASVPEKVVFHDSGTWRYVNGNTGDRYWDKIFQRTAEKVRHTLVEMAPVIQAKGIRIGIDGPSASLFAIDADFINQHHLSKSINFE